MELEFRTKLGVHKFSLYKDAARMVHAKLMETAEVKKTKMPIKDKGEFMVFLCMREFGLGIFGGEMDFVLTEGDYVKIIE